MRRRKFISLLGSAIAGTVPEAIALNTKLYRVTRADEGIE